MAGGKLHNVVVRNERVSKELIKGRCLPQSNYATTFIPLNLIDRRTIPEDAVNRIKHLTKGKARLAKELVEFDAELEPAVNFVFGTTFVTDDEETAKKVAFGNDMQRFNCVTVKGDKYNSGGTLEGGFKQQRDTLLNVRKYKELNTKATQAAESLRKVN